jgi:hypothetical protein
MKTLREYIDKIDEISRRDFLRGAGAVAGATAVGGTGYLQGKKEVYERNVAQSLGFIEEFIYLMPEKWAQDSKIKRILSEYYYWSKRLDPNIRSTKEYKIYKNDARVLLTKFFTPEYMSTDEFKNDAIEQLVGYVKTLRDNAGYISMNIDEASIEAISKIDQLSR